MWHFFARFKRVVTGTRTTRSHNACSSAFPQQRGTIRRKSVCAYWEQLEVRACPSTMYDYTLVAQPGQANIVALTQGASINDSGHVAFVGDTSRGQGTYFWDGTTLTNADARFVSTNRRVS